MEKRRFLEIDMDPSSLVCVNPHEVTSQKPIADTSKQIPTVVPQNSAATNGGGFYEPQRKIKLEMDMEVFSDLSPFVYPNPILMNSVDELNTPLFDKDIFDFGIHNNNRCYQPNEVLVKLEHGYYGNTYTFDNSKFKDNFIHTRDNHSDTGQTYRHGSTSSETSTNNLQNSATSVILSEADKKISPVHITNYNVDDQSALSVGSNENYSVSSPEEQIQYIHSGLVTPPKEMNSNALKNRSPNLTLNVNLKVPSNIMDLATPSIIDSVVDLEAEDFDILNIVGNEDVKISNPGEILNFSMTTPANSLTIQNKKILLAEKKPRKRWRRRNDDEDDDDDNDADYVPPPKRKSVQYRKAVAEHLFETDSDSDSIDIKPITRPRGRPPKRTGSISSECSKDSDTSKYRELRDKNNEASRRSRHKRKMKELEIEKEADELMSNNIKLKAQVEELEKMVTNFRENLFKIMIRK